MKILAIESSCDETAAAVVEDGRRVLSSIVASQLETHKLYGGVVPEIASRMHAQIISSVVREALEKAECTLKDIDAVAVTYAPGLIGALLVGVNFAKGLCSAVGLPLVPVHHLRSHVAANYISSPALEPPFVALIASGGHSHIVKVNSYTSFETIGRTMDDAAGEALDKGARSMGLPYPGGFHLDKLAKNGNALAYSFPHPRVDGRPLDFSFSGLKTAMLNIINNSKQKGDTIVAEDLGASFQKAVVDCLTENVFRAAEQLDCGKIALAGGVCANSLLRSEMQRLSSEKGIALFMPEMSLCGDNAAMVAAQGYYEFLAGVRGDSSLNAYSSMDVDNPVH